MENKEYLEQLIQKSGYCKCPGLQELYEKRREAKRLEKICKFFKENADLDYPKAGDERFLADYQKAFRGFKSAVSNYYESLSREWTNEKVYFALHDPAGEMISEFPTLDKAKFLLSISKPIISIHCKGCSRQFDAIDSIN